MRKLWPVLILVLLQLLPIQPVGAVDRNAPPQRGMHPPVGEIPVVAEKQRLGVLVPPAGDEIVCPAEFCRADGCFLTYETAFGSTQILMDIAYEVALDDTVYMIVKNSSDMNEARSLLQARGVDLDRVRFIYYSQLADNCIWVRDYGPVYIFEDGARAIVDFWYPFTSDDDVPVTIGAEFGLPVYESDLLLSLGNFMTDGNRMGFATQIVYSYNPSYTQAQVRQIFTDYCGIDSLVVLPILDVENTKHIDVFCKLVNDTTFLVGGYATPSDGAGNNYYILNDIAADLDNLQNLDGRDFKVVRLPMPPWEPGGSVGVTRTYANSLTLNDKILVPVYGIDLDSDALGIYQSLFPHHEVIGIDAEQIIHRAGAVHCITKLHHSDNPLIVLHNSLDSLAYGEAPSVAFSLNPGFENTQASVFYRLQGDVDFTKAGGLLQQGVWRCVLPEMEDDFDYYIAASAKSGDVVLEVSLPASAPDDYFSVDVEDATPVARADETDPPQLSLEISPNPFRVSTEIRFAIPHDCTAELRIYNVLGQVVRTFSGFGAGAHLIRWDGRDEVGRPLGVGIYLCRLKADGETRTAKLLVVR